MQAGTFADSKADLAIIIGELIDKYLDSDPKLHEIPNGPLVTKNTQCLKLRLLKLKGRSGKCSIENFTANLAQYRIFTNAIRTLKDVQASKEQQSLDFDHKNRIFPISYRVVDQAWLLAVKRAGLKDFRFHGLCHMAIIRVAKKIPNLIELKPARQLRALAGRVQVTEE